MAAHVVDPQTLSNFNDVRALHYSLELTADFDKKILVGSVHVKAKVQKEAKEFVLDSKVVVKKALVNGAEAKFSLGNSHPVFGVPIHVTLPEGLTVGTEITVTVEYETTSDASALQWLSASQTAGKKHPYLFTQCQAIHARTMLPCQDAPSVKCTYDAKITVPEPLVALMSAQRDGSSSAGEGKKVYFFKQPVAIPAYLIALAVGFLESKEIGPRSRVWTEPEMLEAAAFEFSETEKFITTAESLVGPYVWGIYDLLMLPPSFPYGGMENPCLTFVTPTLLAGDRSNADVVAHEISHSWTGNLVTNVTWEHFWLNEGFTMFLERKILARMHGEKYFHFDALLGLNGVNDTINEFGAEHNFTALVPKLENVDPDDSFSDIPYEKGFNFLFYLQTVVGDIELFEKFFHDWVNKYKFSTASSQDFHQFFNDYFAGKVDEAKLKSIDWNAWLYKPGHLPVPPKYDTTLSEASTNLAKKWFQEGGNKDASADDLKGWSAKQIVFFLESLMQLGAVPIQTLETIDKVYNISSSKNAEIRFRWYQLGIKSEWPAIVAGTVQFLVSQGRMKYVRPLYRELGKSKIGHESAVNTFKANKDMYHAIAQKMIAKDIGLN
jgi:leukotriene-A4 hydrolase